MSPPDSFELAGSEDQLLAHLIEEFTRKLEAGETVDLEAFTREHPERAAELRSLLPAMEVLLGLGRSSSGKKAADLSMPPETLTGALLGDYHILREIGRGGMGIVYEAEQVSLGRRVALKVLPFAAILDPKQIQRFKNEAQAAAQLHHTNIVPVFSVGCERGVYYYAMQYIEGQTLQVLIRGLREFSRGDLAPPGGGSSPGLAGVEEKVARPIPGPITPETSTRSREYMRSVARLGIQAAEALAHAHGLGIVHRDIKPSNLLLDVRGNLWMTDFGLAQIQSESSLTMTGDLLGTLRYMSPEQALGKRALLAHRTDIYSLGITLYELLTLQPAFGSNNREELLQQVAHSEPRPPRHLNRATPAELETIVLKAMAKETGERYSTARELADDLTRFLEDRPILARRPTLVHRARKWVRRHRPLVAASLAILVALVTIFLVSFTSYRKARWKNYVDRVSRAIVLMEMLKPDEFRKSRVSISGLMHSPEHHRKTRLMTVTDEPLSNPVPEAVAELEAAVTMFPHLPDAHYYLAEALFQLKRSDEALREVNLCGPDFLPARLKRAIISNKGKLPKNWEEMVAARPLSGWESAYLEFFRATRGGKGDAGKEAYRKLLSEIERRGEPYVGFSLEVRMLCGRHCLKAKNYEGAIEAFSGAQALWQHLVETGFLLGKTYYLCGKPKAAEDIFLSLYTPPRDLHLVAFQAVSFYHDQGNYDKALEWAKRMGESALRWTTICKLQNYHLGDHEQAVEAGRRAIELDPGSVLAYHEYGVALQNNKNFKEAVQQYSKALELDPDNTKVLLNLYKAYSDQGDQQKANQQYGRLLDLGTDNAWVHYELGNHFAGKNKLDDAYSHYRKAAQLAPESADYQWALGATLFFQGKLDLAFKALEKAIKRDPDHKNTHFFLGCVFLEQGNILQAEEKIRKALELDQDFAEAHHQLGRLLLKQNRIQEAIKELKKDPECPTARYSLGECYRQLENWEEARKCYEYAVQKIPEYAPAHQGIGNVYRAEGKFTKAEAEHREALKLNPNECRFHTDLGVTLWKQGKLKEARKELEVAFGMDPEVAYTLFHLGLVLRDLGERDRAEVHLKKAARLEPENAFVQEELGFTLQKQEKYNEAVAHYKKAIKIDPKRKGSHLQLGFIFERQNKFTEASEHFQKSIDAGLKMPGLVDAHDSLAFIYIRLGRNREAIEHLEKVLELDPARVGSRLTLGVYLMRQGKPVEADARIQAVVRDYPDEALKLLNGWVVNSRRKDPESLSLLARARFLTGDRRAAVIIQEEVLRLPGTSRQYELRLDAYRKVLYPDLPSRASIDAALQRLDAEEIVSEGADWRFFRGKKEPSRKPLEWTRPEFKDSSWDVGPSGFGYGDKDDATVLQDMRENYTTVYIRRNFQIQEPGRYLRFILSVRADDGFVAYLNGSEIGRFCADPNTPWIPFDGVAAKRREERYPHEPVVPFEIILDPEILRPGGNLLALQGLNVSRTSSDLSLIPVLLGILPPDERRDRKLLEDFRGVSKGKDTETLLSYFQGRISQRAGRYGEAAGKFETVLKKDRKALEPFLRLVESLRAAGKPAKARDLLREKLEASDPPAGREIWNLWAAVCLADLEMSPVKLLEEMAARDLESRKGTTPAGDIRWLLEKLGADDGIRINCGGGDVASKSGKRWSRDRFFWRGRAGGRSNLDVAGTEDDALYQTERFFLLEEQKPLSYMVPLPVGQYRIILHFAELHLEKGGNRRFDVFLEGRRFLKNYEPPLRKAKQESFSVPVNDGLLEIEFLPGAVNNPNICAIEID